MSYLAVAVVPQTILPGQTFEVRWSAWRDAPSIGGDQFLPTRAVITHFRIDEIGIDLYPLEAGSTMVGADSGTVRLTSFRLSPFSTFYQSGMSHRLEVVGQLEDGSTLGPVHKTVLIAAPPSSMVGFFSPERVAMSHFPGDVRAVDWGSRYQVNANITNVSPWARVLGAISLQRAENTLDSDAVTNTLAGAGVFGLVGSASATIPPGGTAVVSFVPPLLADFMWLREPVMGGAPGLWELIGPTVKGFTYQVVGHDEFGNAIGGAGSIRVEERVSQEKRNFQLAAQNLANLALGLAPLFGTIAFAFRFLHPEAWWPIFLLQAAGGQGRNALDPPDPDPKFRDEVPLEETSFSKELEEEKELADLREWLRAATHFASVRTAMYAVEAKYLGARLAKDSKAQAAQMKRYRLFVRYLRRDSTILEQRWAPAAKAIDAQMSNEKITDWLTAFANGSLSNEEASSLLALVPASAADALRTTVMKVVARPFKMEALLLLVTQSLSASVADIIESFQQRYEELQPDSHN